MVPYAKQLSAVIHARGRDTTNRAPLRRLQSGRRRRCGRPSRAAGCLLALEAALAAAPREVREGGVGAEARARRDRLLEAQQEAEREAKQKAAAEAARLAARAAVERW